MTWPDCDPLSQGVSLSSALVHLNNLDKRTAFLTRAELKNAKRVVIKLGRSGFILGSHWPEITPLYQYYCLIGQRLHTRFSLVNTNPH